jgi:DNA-binding MarR family transcriptional regulator
MNKSTTDTSIMTFDLTPVLTLPVRVFTRGILIQQGPKTLSDLTRAMGLNPREHKGTIHAVLVQMEQQGILDSTRNQNTGKRDLWFIRTNQIRKRDRLVATLF